VYQTNWRGYELQQSKGSLPLAPMVIAVHLASVWVPFTSEAKEAVAHYDELLREMKLAIQECGRKLAAHIRARAHADRELKRRSLFERYIPEVAGAISEILGLPKDQVEKPFYKTLPTFVRLADEKDEGNGGPPAGAPPAAPGAAPAAPATKPTKRERGRMAPAQGPRRKRSPGDVDGRQMTLLE